MPTVNQRAVVVCAQNRRSKILEEEFVELVRAAGVKIVELVHVRSDRPTPKFFLRSGKVEELRLLAEKYKTDVTLFNVSLSPIQERNLQKEINTRIVDRNGLILDIFAQRAQSFEGKLQVELAQLRHLSTRLIRGWTHLERQKGGIGLRGPGETQLETDRRLIGHRIKRLNKKLGALDKQRALRRRKRVTSRQPIVSLIGYTNAGKSTLFNTLAKSSAYTADMPFATLDPTIRKWHLAPGQEAILIDTVGFVRDLPKELLAAFKSTLQESQEADLLLHVMDVSDPHHLEHREDVNRVIESLGAESIPQIEVYNKIDRVERAASIEVALRPRVWISAVHNQGIEALTQFCLDYLQKLELSEPQQPINLSIEGDSATL